MDDTSSFGSNSGQRLGGAGRRSFLKIKVKASFITNVDKLMNLTVDYFSFTILSVLRIYIIKDSKSNFVKFYYNMFHCFHFHHICIYSICNCCFHRDGSRLDHHDRVVIFASTNLYQRYRWNLVLIILLPAHRALWPTKLLRSIQVLSNDLLWSSDRMPLLFSND